MAEENKRVVSMIASSTEIVCALGFEGSLVGRSHECDFPKTVLRIPVCTRAKLDAERPSKEIDKDVKSLLSRALSVYYVDPEALKKLRPDVIVTQNQCEVCAVSEKDVEKALCDWVGGRPSVVSLEPNALADIWSDIRKVAGALDASERGEELVSRLKTRIKTLSAGARPERRSIACIEWIDPLMSAGNWVPELVELAGGKNLFGEAGKHSPYLKWEDLVSANPDVLIVMPCGFDIVRTRSEMGPLTSRPDWGKLKAVRSGDVYLADGNQYFNRPGPRVVESLEILLEVLDPARALADYEGIGWERLA